MTRKEAIEAGQTHYDGKPCKNCGETLKFVTGYSCVRCVGERTKSRSGEVYSKYLNSPKGQTWIKGFRNSDTYKGVQNRYHKKHYAKDSRPYKNRGYQHRYGITIEQVEQLKDEQGHVCAICKEPRDLVVDHCHTTNKIRAMLCGSCNVGLGMAQESVDILSNMIEYIKYHKEI